MTESAVRRRLICAIVAAAFATRPAAAVAERISAPEAEIEAFLRDPQCGSKAAMDALGDFFRAQDELLVGAGRVAGRLAEAAGKAAPAAAEASIARTALGALAGDVSRAGPGAASQAASLGRALADLETDAGAAAALDLAGVAADGGALETGVGPFLAGCAACASALSAVISDLGSGRPATAARAAGPCGQALEDAAKIGDLFTRIRRFVGAAVTLRGALRNCARDLAAAGDALPSLGQELGKDSQPGLERIETALNRSVDAVTSAAETYDAHVAPRAAKLSPSLLQQIADNTDRLLSCQAKLQDLAGRKTRRLASIPASGSLAVPGGPALARPIAKIRLGVLPPTKVR